jgi:hypothetical protein
MIGDIIGLGTTIIDKIFPDKAKADEAKLRLLELQQSGELKELEAQAQVVTTEAASKHWLAANWRPLTMITFVILIVSRWFGWAAPDLSEAEYLKLWSIVELGLVGYVGGRTLEKTVPIIADAIKSKK